MASVLVSMGEILKKKNILMVHCEKCIQSCILVQILFSLVALSIRGSCEGRLLNHQIMCSFNCPAITYLQSVGTLSNALEISRKLR